MHYNLLQVLILLSVALMLMMLSRKFRLSYPLILVVAGLSCSYIPGIPTITIDPELVLLIFLPPLLYEAAWYTSWNDFWKWKRAIGLLSFGLVIFTSVIVAVVSVALIPGFTLPMGFLLGGIISPPDAVAVTSVLKQMKIPKRVLTILEGESLVNDASSLIVVRFALAAILTGHFSAQQASFSFLLVTIMGICIGLAIGQIIYFIHRFLPTTASIDAAFTLMTPYFMYLCAEHFHCSGVMAVVSGGLFLSYRSHEIFTDGQSRLQTTGVWATLTIMLNGFIFLLMGLQLTTVMGGLKGHSLIEALGYALCISLIVIFIRVIWVFPATFIPRILFKSVREKEASPGWKGPFIIAWSGMRGMVSLAAAMSLPVLNSAGEPLPGRSLIIFITFVVILITLVLQGLSLPFLIRKINIPEIDPVIPANQQELTVRLRLMEVALKILDNKYLPETRQNELLKSWRSEMHDDWKQSTEYLRSVEDHGAAQTGINEYNKIILEIYHAQRKELFQIRKERLISDNIIRNEEMLIALSEVKLAPYQNE